MSSNIILDAKSLREAVDYFRTQPAFVFDVEASGENRDVPHLASLSWISLATKGMAVTIPFGHPIGDKIIGETREARVYGPNTKKAGQTYFKTVPVYEPAPKQLLPGEVFGILEPLFFDPKIKKCGHDVIYDLTSSGKYWGAIPVPPYDDTKIDMWLLNENRKRYGLKDAIEETYGFRYDFENIGACVEKYPFSKVAFYSYCDSKYGWLLLNKLMNQISEQGLTPIHDLEMELLNVMVGMRLAGARVDVPKLKELKQNLSVKLVETEGMIYQAAGRRFNINSVPQKQDVLYSPPPQGQGLKPWKLTKSGSEKQKSGQPLDIHCYSTDDDVLASFQDNAVTSVMREYGDISKILSTYVLSWLGDNERSPQIFDEHIHAGFQQYGTVTGRFSCRTPNLQNIPRPYTDLGKLIRGVFVAEPGGKLISGDYSQIELVVLAHYVGEGKLFEGFMNGIDPHTMTAAMVLGKKPQDVTKVERQDLGKTLGFAVVYGAGLYKVASMAKVSVQEAKQILKKHELMFPEIHGFKQAVIDLCRSRTPVPYITTLLGRKRRVKEINSSVDKIRLGAERQVFNSLIQGGAADLIKLAMIRLDAMLPPEIQLILTVHDELVMSAPENMAQEAASILKEAMTGAEIQKLVKVPLSTDIKIVDRWSDAK